MSEPIAAEIWIGGRVSKRLAVQLCDAVRAEGVSLEWGGGRFAPKAPAELLDALDLRDNVQVLHACDDQANYGEFPSLEAFLQQRGLPYTRLSEPKYEFDGELVDFRPGHKASRVRTDAAGNPIVGIGDVLKASSLLDKTRKVLETGKKPGRAFDDARRILRRALPRKLPPLAPFEIIGVKLQDAAAVARPESPIA
jgi:hypothetical protein